MNVNPYLKICAWAWRRYTDQGRLVVIERGRQTVYTRIEAAAWAKYVTH